MKLRTFVPLAAALLLAAPAARAQDADSTGSAHRNAISLSVGGSSSIGLWHRVSPRTELGVEVFGRHETADYPGGQEARSSGLSLRPAIKAYGRAAGPVRPYVYGDAGVTFSTVRSESPDVGGGTTINRSSTRGFGAALGLGLQWSPLQRVSLGGHAGVDASWGRSRSESGAGPALVSHGSNFGTFSSGLTAQLYF